MQYVTETGVMPGIDEMKAREKTRKEMKRIKRAEASVRGYQRLLLRVGILILVIWALFFQIVGLTHMPGEDMYPRVDAGDMVMFYRLDKNVSAQDVIVLEKATPDSGGKAEMFVSRVVAVAGDTVEVTDGGVIINGNHMVENNIYSTTTAYEGYTQYPLTLGEGQCFVLADSRDGGTDSRYFGPVDKSEIKGTVITVLRRMNI